MSFNDNGRCKEEERVYIALKAHVLERRSLPGVRLETDALAKTFRADHDATLSALIVLALEKLIDFRPGEGFFTKVPSMRECRSLYLYKGALLAASLRDAVRQAVIVQHARDAWIDPRTTAECSDDEAVVRFAESLFVCIGRLSGSPVILEAIIETNARLHAFRRAETAVFADSFESVSNMCELLKAGWFLELIATIENYHRRRVAHVREIIRAGTTGSGEEVALLNDSAPLFSAVNGSEHGAIRQAGDR